MMNRAIRLYPYFLFPAVISAFVLAVFTNLMRTTTLEPGETVAIHMIYIATAAAALIMAAAAALFGLAPSLRRKTGVVTAFAALVMTGIASIPGLTALLNYRGDGYAAVPGNFHSIAAILGMGFSILTAARFYSDYSHSPASQPNLLSGSYNRLSLLAAAAGLAVIISGLFVGEPGAVSTCSSWPLCNGFTLTVNPGQWPEVIHRVLVVAAVISLIILVFRAWKEQRRNPVVLTAATAAASLYFSQALLGGLNAARGYPLDLVSLHSTAAAAAWGALVLHAAAAILIPRPAISAALSDEPIPFRLRLKDFLILTKPVIVALLLVTTYAGMVVGGRSIPPLGLTVWTLLAGALAAGGSGAINQYIDRDLDRNMQRTARRPLPAGRVTPAEGLAFGTGLLVAAFFIMAAFANLLAAVLSLAGMVYYILLYSIFLKKATVQNIVIGGGAGAIPPLVGWAAASGSLSIPALFLFAIVFLWTPPHFWALALVRRKDYARAGVPMLPVVRGEKATQLQILIYTLELVGLTLLMPVFNLTGSLFLVSAVVLGGALIFTAWRVYRHGGNKTAWQMYRYSSMYLAFIFFALVLDVLI